MKIVFFGSSDFSVPVLQALISSDDEVTQVVTTPDKPKGRGQKVTPSTVKSFAEKVGLSVMAPEKLNRPEVLEGVQKLHPDFLVVASYGKLVPDSLLKIPKMTSLNVHPSLIPKYRGASPIQAAILAGDQKTGVTIMEVTKELDAGDIFGQAETPLDPDENAAQLSERLAHLGSDLLLKIIDQFKRGKVLRKPQDNSKASYAKKIERDSGRIDWASPGVQIHNQVRAYYPWPSAYTFFRDKRLKIIKTALANAPVNPEQPGTVFMDEAAKKVYVHTQDRLLELVSVQAEGKREMGSFEFAIGQRINSKERLTS
jgi:methionyl-tRNA formyltransferase